MQAAFVFSLVFFFFLFSPAEGLEITKPGVLTQRDTRRGIAFSWGAAGIFIVEDLLKQKHCAVSVYGKALYWVVNHPNVLPKDILDNNWWKNVKGIAWS